MKQSLAIALAGLQGLGTTDDHRERPVDRLGALAMAQIQRADNAARQSFLASLGGDLIAFKFGNRAASKLDAEAKLEVALAWRELRLRAGQRKRIAAWAIQEWAIDLCPVCKGAKEVPDHSDLEGAQPMKPCPPSPTGCGGSGKRRYSDEERIEALGETFARAMDEAHRLIGAAEDIATRETIRRVGRG